MLGDHGILGTTVMYEEAMRVPLIMRAPWLGRDGRLLKGRVGHVDLVPTLLDLMGEPVTAELEGVSRGPVLRGEATLAGNDVFVGWNGRDRHDKTGFETDISAAEMENAAGAVRRTVITAEGWKLTLCVDDRRELYDLNAGPLETQNLFDDPAQGDRVRDLTSRIGAWQGKFGDAVPLPDVR